MRTSRCTRSRRPIVFFLAAALFAGPAAAEVQGVFETGKIVETIVTQHDPGQQYALYLPSRYVSQGSQGAGQRTWPVLFVLDPRGRAVPGIERFLPAAERHGFIVVSSYQSRSDTWASVTSKALEALLRDAEVRFRMDKRRLYLAGMSGTSHASWRLAQQLGDFVAGVIGCGGGVQEETQGPPGDASFAYYGITAPADFNYQETLRLERHMIAGGIDHRIDMFSGRHGWSPPKHTNRALDWMQLQAIRRGLAAMDEPFVESQYRAALTALADAEDPLDEARRRRDLVRDFSELREVTEQARALRRLEGSESYRSRLDQERKLARQEEAYYRQRLGKWLAAMQDLDRPAPTLAASRATLRLDRLLADSADPDRLPESHSAQRILDSVYTTAAFSLPGSFGGIGAHDRTVRALEVAAAIYPRRARTFWSLAAAHVRAGETDEAFEALRSATSLGWVDVERLETDTTWEPLRKAPEWQELLRTVRRSRS